MTAPLQRQVKSPLSHLIGLMCLLAFCISTNASAADSRLFIPFPAGWELVPVKTTDNTLYLRARQQQSGVVVQQLQLTATNLRHATAPITSESIESLATKLRDAVASTAMERSIPLKPFRTARGYYFVATDRAPKPGEFKQMVEGIMLVSGYLVNFTLLTNTAEGTASQAVLVALDTLTIH